MGDRGVLRTDLNLKDVCDISEKVSTAMKRLSGLGTVLGKISGMYEDARCFAKA